MFLSIDGIEGESQDDKHKGEIEIESFSWGVKNSGSVFGGGGGAGKAIFDSLSLVHRVDKASVRLALATATGQHLKFAELTVRKAGGNQQEYLTYKLEDLLVSSVTTSGSSGTPVETVSLNFSKLEISYHEQKADGSLGPAITAILTPSGP